MNTTELVLSRWAAAVSIALAGMSPAWAQQAPPPPAQDAAPQNPLDLEEIVVTASSSGASKMKSSISVSTLDAAQLQQVNAASAAEVLRAIPGIRSESSGGESNANLTVRGVPISAGGARYVQYQEDGLPVLQFGDIAFATPDSFIRADYAVERLEVVRGGSASTLATNAPGGIINFITQRGDVAGGAVGVSYGLDYDQTRYDFAYGGPITDDTHFHVAGFYRVGEGAREPGVNVEQGGQLRGSLTHEFDNGHVTVRFKHLDDHAPTFLPVPVRFGANGKISEFPGIDPRDAAFYSPYWLSDSTLTRDNQRVLSDVNDGLTAKSDAVDLEAGFDLSDHWTITDRFRTADNSGRFIGIFPGDDPAPVSTTYATGPKAGQAYNGMAFTAVVFNTSLDDFGLTANDLRLTGSWEAGESGVLKLTGGLYTSQQTLDVTWNFNQYLLEATGHKPALLTSAINGSNAFGGCCSNTQQSQYDTTAPYAVVSWEYADINLDASVRQDDQKATGTYNQLLFAPAGSTTYDQSAAKIIDYGVDHTSYSVGGNYRLTEDLALFARYSDGVAFNADRITFFHDPGLVDGSSPVPVNTIKQTEAGAKWRMGALSTFLTLFKAETEESNFDVTTQKSSANTYDSKGVELEFGYRIGGLSLNGGATWTDAEITASSNPALVGTTPKRQADLIYQFTSSYRLGKMTVGTSVIGTTNSKDDSPAGPITVTLPAYAVVNAFASYTLFKDTELSLGANNLLDEIGYTESNDGRQAARSINGRTLKAGVKYSF